MRANGEGSGSLLRHHIAANVMSTTAQHFESTYLLRPDMVSKLNEWLSFCSHDDKRKRRCVRALANWYETTLHRSSKDCKPLLEPHRDNVNNADLTIVLGITPTSEYRGAALYVSKIAKHGKIWFEKEGIPSRKSVESVDLCRGVCVILRNNAEHYVSTLQSGKRASLVFHMTPE